MLTDASEGFDSPRGTAARIWGVSALFLLLVAILPSTIFLSASSWSVGGAVREFMLPVLRPDPGFKVQIATSVRHDPDFKLDARSTLDLFHAREYRIDAVRSGEMTVPRLVLTDLPTGITTLESTQDRKALFVKTLLPLILMANERIEQDRHRLERLLAVRQSGEALAPHDRLWLADLAEHYGMKPSAEINIKGLLQRVDVIPASLALAQAAEESGWGTSRFAQRGNALFGQLTWNTEHAGIVPRNRQPGETHRFRAFDAPKGSVDSYVHNLNTHRAYAQFRQMRASLRAQEKPISGLMLATALTAYSERGEDYVRTIRSLIRVNSLSDFDAAMLSADLMEEVLGPLPAGDGPQPALATVSAPRNEGVVPASMRR
ncbi:glucosaminidase domain-containing protein [Niveispirillum fermenti]|uniref:glucosaminidase domain-containing protein n=1 Tax=Niveispirillum fermenti TaxID=1233113 RepID=UPI003A8B72E8